MDQAEPIVLRDMTSPDNLLCVGELAGGHGLDERAFIADAVGLTQPHSAAYDYLILFIAAASGASAAAFLPTNPASLITLVCALAFVGGLLSTWSPCGYSSLSTLRIDPPQDSRAIMRWLPTMLLHAVGYAAGGVLLALTLTGIGLLLPVLGFGPWSVAALAITALLYGLHQLDIIKMPYPQLRLQVSHGARMDLPKWATGLLYGAHLGLNFATYVRTPILYVIVLACVLSGNLLISIAIVASLNAGRFLPLLVNLLPVPDWTVQRWMAAHDRAAVTADGSILVFFGTFLMASAIASLL